MKKLLVIILFINVICAQDLTKLISDENKTLTPQSISIEKNANLTDLENLTYTPVEAPINPDTYILGPGDLLGVNIISTINISTPIRVNPVGEILIPSVGILNVSGISLSQARTVISDFIKTNALKNSIVDITLLDVRTIKIQILGAIFNPGYIYISSLDRLYDAIQQSGGLQKFAHPELVQVKRGDQTIDINLTGYLSGKDLTQNIFLQSGDIIFVPFNEDAQRRGFDSISLNKNQIVVYGYVNRAGSSNAFDYYPGYTVRDYIALAGGTKEQNSSFRAGNINRTKLYRADGTKINNALDYAVLPGDMIEVPPSLLYQIVGGDGIIRTLASIASSAYIVYRFSQEK
jgi:protein involved in polysaccharide export with SLBB domain